MHHGITMIGFYCVSLNENNNFASFFVSFLERLIKEMNYSEGVDVNKNNIMIS